MLISSGDDSEDSELFKELETSLRRDLAPVGALEELLVDQLVAFTWRWTRVLRYETASFRLNPDKAVHAWEKTQRERSELDFLRPLRTGSDVWTPSEELEMIARDLEEAVDALGSQAPLEARPELWWNVFEVANERFKVPIRKVLSLKEPWDELSREFTEEEIERVINCACEKGNLTRAEFWARVKEIVQVDKEQASQKWDERRKTIDGVRALASLGTDHDLGKVQRYEAHISRQFYRALGEL